MENLTLKRGCGIGFFGMNWDMVGDRKWHDCPPYSRDGIQSVFVPSGKEIFMGNKVIRGIDFSVYKCLDDGFFAQPTRICELPVPEDCMEILCTSEDLGKIC